MKLGIVEDVLDPTPHDNFGGRNPTRVVWAYTRLVKSRSFFSFLSLFLFFAFLTDRDDLYVTTRVSGQGYAL